MADSAKIVPTAFSDMAGVTEEKPRIGTNPNDLLKTTSLGKYSDSEYQSIIKNTYVSQKDIPNPNLTNAEGLISYFLPIHEQVGQVLFDTEKMKKLAPEINQARLIRVSSIMSPNDLQEGQFIFDLDQIPGLTEDAKKSIIKVIGDYFNKVEQFGKKANDWIGKCLYGPGAVPVVVLPSSYQKAMRKDGLHVIGNSSIDLNVPKDRFNNKQAQFEKMFDESIFNLDTGLESWTTPFKEPEKYGKLTTPFTSLVNGIMQDFPLDKFDDKTIANLKIGIEQMTVRFVKQIEEGDVIKISENPEIIKFATEYRKTSKKFVEDKIDARLQAIMNYDMADMVSLNKYEGNKETEDAHPLMLELPAEAVIPICVPSNEKEHLGYFVLLDETGQPLKADARNTNRTYGWGGSPQAAHQAVYGATDKNVFNTAGFKSYEEQTIKRVFNGLLDQFLKARLKGIGMDEVSVDKSNAITTTMLYRMLESKRTRILFIPATLLTYICFDYRPNGTGKSLLEDAHYLLSLRVTFQVAALMGMAKDAINHRTLNLSLDQKETNPLALMDQIVNAFVEKERMPFSMDPTEISRSIARNAISVAPSNLRGLSDFKIERVNDGGGGGNKPDTELLDTLTNMFITALGVPPNALNKLSDQEFAVSVTTNNLFFSKQVLSDQSVYCDFKGKIAKTYIKYSPKLRERLLEIINEFIKEPDTEKLDEKTGDRGTEPSTQPSPELDNDITKKALTILNMVIDNLRLTLPTPNIAQDKAQYQEIKDYMATVSEFLDIIFAPELVPSDNMEASAALGVMKANIKRMAINDFMNKIGTINTLEIPTIEEFIAKYSVDDMVQSLMNMNKGLKNVQTRFGNADSSFGGGMDDMGGDMGMPGMDEEPNPMDMGAGSTTPQAEEPTDILPPEVPASKPEENNGGMFIPK